MNKFFAVKFILVFVIFSGIQSKYIQATEIEDVINTIDSIENSFIYSHENVILKDGIGTLHIPEGFKYLDSEQAEYVLTELWGNPKRPDMTMGLILRDDQLLLSDTGYVFNIQYDEIGFVDDDDAEDIDYNELLETMQKESIEANKERKKLGYEPISVEGWASKPYYDANKKILHWAKEIKFGDSEVNTLNYNIRILGRKGVLVLNAISSMPNFPVVQQDLSNVLDIVQFNDGHKYSDFNPEIDKVAAWSIGGLVAGKMLAKVGFFAVILKFWKVIILAVGGFFGAFGKKLFKRNKD